MSCGDHVKGCLIKKETHYDGSGPGLKWTGGGDQFFSSLQDSKSQSFYDYNVVQ